MGLSPLALRVVARTVDITQLYQGCGSDRAAMLNWTSFRAFERGYAAEAPIRVIPRVGSAYKPKGYSSHPSNPLSILLIFCRDNHYRCSYLIESRTTTTVRSTPITRAGTTCPVVPPTLGGYRQGEPSTYLVSGLLRRARLSYNRISFGHEQY